MPARAPFRLTAPRVPEHPIQKSIADTLRLEIGPPGKVSRFGVVWWSIDHANYAGEVPGVRIGRGIISGIPDTFLLYRGRAHMIEIKAEGTARLAKRSSRSPPRYSRAAVASASPATRSRPWPASTPGISHATIE